MTFEERTTMNWQTLITALAVLGTLPLPLDAAQQQDAHAGADHAAGYRDLAGVRGLGSVNPGPQESESSEAGDRIPCLSSGQPGAAEDSRQDYAGLGVDQDTQREQFPGLELAGDKTRGTYTPCRANRPKGAAIAAHNKREAGYEPAGQHQLSPRSSQPALAAHAQVRGDRPLPR
jgi:hypothetical protein